MNYKTLKCPACGQEKIELKNGKFYCRYCSCTFTESDAKKALVELDKNILLYAGKADKAKQNALKERFFNLRTLLWYRAHAKSNGSKDILAICDELIKIAPDDFPAHFYRLVYTGKPSDVVNFINHLDVLRYRIYVERIIECLLNFMQSEYVAPLKYLVERTFGETSLEKYKKYITKIETEAERVEPTIYQYNAPRKVFISYAQRDTEKVLPLLRLLEEHKISYFAALRNLRYGKTTGTHYEEAFKAALDNSAILVFVASKHSCNASCNALSQELPYVKNKELAAIPAEYKNRTYATLPASLKKPRIEYRLDNERSTAADAFLQEFFADGEYCDSSEGVLNRIQQYLSLLSTSETKEVVNEEPEKTELPEEEPVKKISARKARKLAKKAAKKEKKAQKKAAKKAAKAERKSAKKQKKTEDKYYGSPEYLSIFRIEKKAIKAFRPTPFTVNAEGVVVIPDGITRIEEGAFANCETLREIRIGNGVQYVGAEAFSGCIHLKKVVFGESVEEIAHNAFCNCPSLEEINLPDSLQVLGDSVFECCEGLKSVQLPKKLTHIPEAAFADCVNLQKVVFGESIKRISEDAFFGCLSLEKIELPEGIETLGDGVFEGCEALRSVRLPQTLLHIPGAAFAGCVSLTEVIIPENVESMGGTEEYETDIFKKNARTKGVFEGCTALEEILLPGSLKHIGDHAFYGCTALHTVEMSGVESVGAYAFANCTALEELNLSQSIVSIGDRAFERCLHLKTLYLSENIENIGFAAFHHCPDLQIYMEHKKKKRTWTHTCLNMGYGPILWRYKQEKAEQDGESNVHVKTWLCHQIRQYDK